MWSAITIPGPPKVLIANEVPSEFSRRLTEGLLRSGLQTAEDERECNCLILFGPRLVQFPACPFLLALTTHEHAHLLKSTPPIAPIVVAPTASGTPRQIGLFYLKFFTELKLHCPDAVTGKMAWFAFSKAKELLRRRRYDVQFGIRC